MKTDNPYYTAPCDLWRGLIKDKINVLETVLCWLLAERDFDVEKARCEFGVRYGNPKDSVRRAKILKESEHSKVLFSISKTMYWEYHDNNKSPEELLLLLFYLASKSIVGHKKYVLTNNRHVWCRMAGYDSFTMWKSKNTHVDKVINDHIRDERKRQRKTAILREKAAASFHYCSYSERGLRGYYFSTKANSSDEKTQIMREMKQAARKPTKRQQERERLRNIRNE